jgi:UDP-3-O-[3-hydroxymyristoyl] N-acetylglucosamine deacetylase
MVEKRTIGREISISGIGIHTGQKVRMVLKPSLRGEIIFRRLDLDNLELRVEPRHAETGNCTALVSGSARVRTIEHLLAVLFVLGLDSLDIELDADEIPITDGSAAPLARAVLEAGIRPLPEKKTVIRIVRPWTIAENKASVSFRPAADFSISYAIEFSHPSIGRQELSLAFSRWAFLSGIAPARTFGFLSEVRELRRRGLALGGSMENAVVLDTDKIVSGPLRFPDEFVRHKILDLTGDLALLSHPLLGRFEAERAGHSLHLKAVHFLLENPDFWVFEDEASPRFLRA